MTAMRSRTTYCPHGFVVPPKPEPWTKLGLKASRFCLKCWANHGEAFFSNGYAHIQAEDPCSYGFLDLIHFVIKDRGYWRDQDRFEFLETELRLHLIEKRELIEEALREQNNRVKSYVREALNRKLQDLQKSARANSAFIIETKSGSFDENGVYEKTQDFNPNDESQNTARVVEATGSVDPFIPTKEGYITCSHRAATSITANRLIESEAEIISAKDPLKNFESRRRTKTRAQENAQLVRAAIEEQGHRLDALTILTQKEEAHELKKAHRALLAAIDNLPQDEQTAIRLRFLEGEDLRDGKPRSRSDILRELRINGNGRSAWSEWDLRRLEQQAIFRLRSKVDLPAIFKNRD